MDAIYPVPNDSRAQYVWCPILQEPAALVAQPRASLTEKWSSTNRIRSQFARIKAAKRYRYRLWLLRKTRLYGTKSPAFRSKRRSGHFAKRKSGNVRTIGRGDQAAHHARTGLDMAAGTACRVGPGPPPGAAVGQ